MNDATAATRSRNYQEQSSYFSGAKYRQAADPVVAAYANPKLDFVERVVPLSQSSVLDVGCGNGVFTWYLQQRCRGVTGLDFSDHMLRENPCDGLVRADVAALPVASQSFDVTFEANVLHHVDHPRTVVAEMARASKRWVVLVEPNRNNPIMFAFGLAVKAERASLRSHRGYLRGLLEECGLKTRLVLCTGMISQNNTPKAAVPVLRYFDREFALGEYVVAVGEK
jgi:SAM-dependent methyltransferase